jgi:hypothetical protein
MVLDHAERRGFVAFYFRVVGFVPLEPLVGEPGVEESFRSIQTSTLSFDAVGCFKDDPGS